jgi:NTE family protein
MLSGGGARAAYQVGALAFIGQQAPELQVPILTGVSAGAINAGYLGAHRGNLRSATAGLKRRWASLTTEEVFRGDAVSLAKIGARWGASLISGGSRLAPTARGLVDTFPLRDFLHRAVDPTGISDNLESGRLLALALSAMSYRTGCTVTFVQGNAPIRLKPDSIHHRAVRARITIDHIMASAAIPLLFPAVKLGQQHYGDGSFRHAAPFAPAIQLGADRILAVSARYPRSAEDMRRPDSVGYPPPARIIGLLLNSAFLDTLDWDAAHLRRINRLLARLPESTLADERLRHVELLILRPSKDLGCVAAQYESRLPRMLRFLVRGLGTPGTRSADLLSYLLFESAYITELGELGWKDAERQWPRLASFLEAGPG